MLVVGVLYTLLRLLLLLVLQAKRIFAQQTRVRETIYEVGPLSLKQQLRRQAGRYRPNPRPHKTLL